MIYDRIKRVIIDSAPKDRERVYSCILNNYEITEHQLIANLRIPRTTLQRILDILYRLDLIDKHPTYDLHKTWTRKSNTLYLNNGAAAPENSQRVLEEKVE